jgi:hypothetical protein
VKALDGVNGSLGAFDHPPPIDATVGSAELRGEALTKRTDVRGSLQEYQAAQAALRHAVANQRQALGALEDPLQQPLFDPGQFPSVPEEDPRLVRREPTS